MFVDFLLIALAISACIFWWYRQSLHKRPANFPAGPPSIPFVGSLPWLGKNPVKRFQEWKIKYGSIVGFNFSTFRTVMINDPNWIKEAYEQEVFSGRPSLPPLLVLSGGRKRGLIPSEGQTWVEQRRFALRNLRDFGFGKKSMEGMIHEDIEYILTELKATNGKPIDTSSLFSIAILCSLWNIIAGERLDIKNDPKFKLILDKLRSFIQSLQFGSISVLFYSWLAKVAPGLRKWNKFSLMFDPIKDIFRGYIADHKATYDPNNMRDFIDVFLQENKATADQESSFYGQEGEENLLIAILNLFAAGSETTSNTINWALLLLSLHPEALTKLQTELDTVVGKDRLPSFDDRDSLIYTQAVIQEVLRYSTIAPFGVFHNTMGQVKNFHGYDLPKDTMVMANLYGVHYDKEIWGDPQNFRPERFLTEDGKSLKKNLPLMSFSVGKRVCLGEVLARNEFFLFLTCICQKFRFVPDPDKPTPNPENTITSLIRFPQKFWLCFYERQ